jgi:hypothetical protein
MERGMQKSALIAVAVSLIVFTGCSQQNTESPQAKQEASKKQAEEKGKKIAELQQQKKAELARQDEAKKKIPVLLAKSDSALKLSEQFKNVAVKAKDPTKKSELQQKATKAQAVANEKSQEIMVTYKSIYEANNEVRKIDAKIATLTAEKKRAEQLALGDVQPASTTNKM